MELKNTNRYQELDALRGIAALMVVFFHLTMETEHNAIFKFGTTGVDLFFIISGFVIFMSLQRIANGRDFVINRVSRLYPTYWAAVTFTSFFIIAGRIFRHKFTSYYIAKYLGNMTMFQLYLGIPDMDGPYWTMIVEMLFYIGILFLYQRHLLKHINIIGAVACLIPIILTRFFYEVSFVKQILFYIPLLQFIPLFFSGILFYKIYTEATGAKIKYILIIYCLLCQISLFPYSGRSVGFITFNEYCLILSVYFILFTAFVNHKLGFIVNRVTTFLGKVSFALYLIHQYVSISLIMPFLTKILHLNFWVAAVFIDVPIVLCLAAFITYKIEVPYSKKMKEKLKKYNLRFQEAVK